MDRIYPRFVSGSFEADSINDRGLAGEGSRAISCAAAAFGRAGRRRGGGGLRAHH